MATTAGTVTVTDRVTVALFSLAAFLVVLAFLGSQLRAPTTTAPARPREVLVRKVYRTTVVESVPRAGAGGSATGGGTTESQSVSGAGALPAAVAAPVVTRTS